MAKTQKDKDFELVSDVIRDQMDKDTINYNTRVLTELTETYLRDIQETAYPVRRDVENWAKHTTLLSETSNQYEMESLDAFPKATCLQVLSHKFLKDSLKDKDFCESFASEINNYPTVTVATMGLFHGKAFSDYMDKEEINAVTLFNDNIKQIKKSVDVLTKSLSPWVEETYPNCFAMSMNLPYDKKNCLGEIASYQYLETMTDYLSENGKDKEMSFKEEWKAIMKQIEKELPNEFKKSFLNKNKKQTVALVNER